MGDLIDRQKAIERIVSIRPSTPKQSDYSHGVDVGMAMAMVAIKEQPSAEPERKTGKWIPVIEKLPPECEEVNITWVNRNPESYYAHIKGKPFTGAGIYCRGRWFWYSATCKDYCEEYGFSQVDEMDEDIQVLAWMPLPEPYQEVSR